MLHAGYRDLAIIDAVQDVSFSALLLYPTPTPASPTAFGPYQLEVAAAAPLPAAGMFPLAVLSHGNGGSPLLYRELAVSLARQGFIVVCPWHPGNSLGDNALADTRANLLNRPRHIGLCLDAVLQHPVFGPRVNRDAIAGIGHSMGAYTVLCAAGGVPWTREGERIEVRHDSRLRALVLLAPAGAFFGAPGSLDQVSQPMLILAAEHDAVTPGWQATLLRDHAPDRSRVQLRVVPGSGHFSFLGPFPPQMRHAQFAPSQDPPGFDREAFQQQLARTVPAWLAVSLGLAERAQGLDEQVHLLETVRG